MLLTEISQIKLQKFQLLMCVSCDVSNLKVSSDKFLKQIGLWQNISEKPRKILIMNQ